MKNLYRRFLCWIGLHEEVIDEITVYRIFVPGSHTNYVPFKYFTKAFVWKCKHCGNEVKI